MKIPKGTAEDVKWKKKWTNRTGTEQEQTINDRQNSTQKNKPNTKKLFRDKEMPRIKVSLLHVQIRQLYIWYTQIQLIYNIQNYFERLIKHLSFPIFVTRLSLSPQNMAQAMNEI